MSISAKNSTTVTVLDANNPASSPASELLDAVLFSGCTPEEATSSVGLPIATARQQVWLSITQLRTSRMS